MALSLTAYWGCDGARYVDMHMAALSPRRYQRAMRQLSREVNRLSIKETAIDSSIEEQTLAEKKQSRRRIRKMQQGFQPYRNQTEKSDSYAITAHQGSVDAAYISAIVQQDQRVANQRVSAKQKRRWATQPVTRIQAKMMKQLGLRLTQNSSDGSLKEHNKPVSQVWIRNNLSQLHGLSLLLELDNRQNEKQNAWGTLPKRALFSNDPQWVRAIATVILLS